MSDEQVVKRFDFYIGEDRNGAIVEEDENPTGEYVKYENYATLEQRVADYKDANETIMKVSRNLCERIAELQAAQTRMLVRLYNSGYAAGHEDTVEARYTHIFECDKDTYHADVVADFLADYAPLPTPPAAQGEQ